MTSMLAASNPTSSVLDENNTALPPGRICGQRRVISPFCKSVTGVGGPPADGTRDGPPTVLGPAMMLPSSPQLPPVALGAEHKVIAEPPSTEIFFIFDCA